MGGVCYLLLVLLRVEFGGPGLEDKLVMVLVPLLAGVAVFLGASRLFGLKETFELIRAFQRRRGKTGNQ